MTRADRSRRWYLAIAIALAIAPACGGGSTRPAHPRAPVRLVLPALDGGQIDLARYRGRVVVLHVFTTWSLTAQADVEQLTAAHQEHGDDAVILGLALDPDGYRLVAPWRTANRIPYLITLATEDVRRGTSSLGRFNEVPTTVILARDGTLARRVEGPLRQGQLGKLLAHLIRGR
jgi:hypothetical protein